MWRSVTWQIIKHVTVKPVPEKVKKPTVPEKTKLRIEVERRKRNTVICRVIQKRAQS